MIWNNTAAKHPMQPKLHEMVCKENIFLSTKHQRKSKAVWGYNSRDQSATTAMVLNSSPQLWPRHHGFHSLQKHIATAITEASASFVHNFPQYQGSWHNHNRNRDCNLKPCPQPQRKSFKISLWKDDGNGYLGLWNWVLPGAAASCVKPLSTLFNSARLCEAGACLRVTTYTAVVVALLLLLLSKSSCWLEQGTSIQKQSTTTKCAKSMFLPIRVS